jgi:hypothetical protein
VRSRNRESHGQSRLRIRAQFRSQLMDENVVKTQANIALSVRLRSRGPARATRQSRVILSVSGPGIEAGDAAVFHRTAISMGEAVLRQAAGGVSARHSRAAELGPGGREPELPVGSRLWQGRAPRAKMGILS